MSLQGKVIGMLAQQIVNGITIGSIYALIALGLTIVYGVLKILHIAHAGVYAMGAYLGLWVYRFIPNLFLAMVVSMALSGVAGIVIERFLYKSMLDKSRIVPLIASIGLFIAMEEAFRIISGPYVKAFPVHFRQKPWIFGSVRISAPQMLVFGVTIALLVLLWWVISKTRMGKALRAVSMDREMADALGVATERIISLSFFISSALAGAAGVLVGVFYNSVYPTMGDIPAYKALAIIVLGGMGSIPGTILGAFLVGISETFLIGFVNIPLPRDALAFIVMIAVLMFRPYGLLGKE